MKYIQLKYHLLIASITTVLCLGGCTIEEDIYPIISQGEEQTTDNTKLILTVNTTDSGNTTRAISDQIEGMTDESSYSSVAVYFTNVNGEIENTIIYPTTSGQKNIVIPIDNLGIDFDSPKHIYLAANPTEKMQQDLTVGANIKEAVGAITDINEVTTNGKFLMLGQATFNGNETITFTKGAITSAKVTLSRVSAKVLVTAKVGADEYIENVEDGFILKSNLRYMLQTTNGKFRYLPNADRTDTNHTIANLLERKNGSIEYTTNGNDFLNLNKWNINGNNGTIITPRDDSRIESGSSNAYTEGIYCLENTTSATDGLELSAAEMIDIPKMVTTYLRIAAKIIPNKIDGTTYTDGNQAQQKLNNNGTFYTYTKAQERDKKMCYSSIDNAKDYLRNQGYSTLLNSDFKEYAGGWIYFEVYINGYIFDAEKSSLYRNNYYIVNINKIVAPIVDQTIEINTKITDWKNKGTTIIDIETPTI